jgi:hypothetical protein
MAQAPTQDGKGQGAARRLLLRTLGIGAAAAAVTPAAGFEPDGSTGGLPPQKEGEAERRRARYRETDHVKAFYRTNRY